MKTNKRVWLCNSEEYGELWLKAKVKESKECIADKYSVTDLKQPVLQEVSKSNGQIFPHSSYQLQVTLYHWHLSQALKAHMVTWQMQQLPSNHSKLVTKHPTYDQTIEVKVTTLKKVSNVIWGDYKRKFIHVQISASKY